jgi:hypothetical protein
MSRKRTEKLMALKFVARKSGLVEDRWGNYKVPSGKYRIKFKKVAVRAEKKFGKEWLRIWSATWNDLGYQEFGDICAKLMKK